MVYQSQKIIQHLKLFSNNFRTIFFEQYLER